MRLVNAGETLQREFGIDENTLYWLKTVNDIDLLQHGGWMFIGDWIDPTFEEGIDAPCPVICKVINDNGEYYHLFILEQDGTFQRVMLAHNKDWAYILLPEIISYFESTGNSKRAEVVVSGEALNSAKWIKNMLADEEADLNKAVAFALKFTRESWTKSLENTIQSNNQDT